MWRQDWESPEAQTYGQELHYRTMHIEKEVFPELKHCKTYWRKQTFLEIPLL